MAAEYSWFVLLHGGRFSNLREKGKSRLLIAGATAEKAARVDRWIRECASHGQLRISTYHGLCSLYMETQKLSGRICVSQFRTPLCDPSVILLFFIPPWELRCSWRWRHWAESIRWAWPGRCFQDVQPLWQSQQCHKQEQTTFPGILASAVMSLREQKRCLKTKTILLLSQVQG